MAKDKFVKVKLKLNHDKNGKAEMRIVFPTNEAAEKVSRFLRATPKAPK